MFSDLIPVYATLAVFMLLGLGFLTVGLLMITALKRNFEDFYSKVSCGLWAATFLLDIPMFIRAINWIM
jgi:hypothetical protein